MQTGSASSAVAKFKQRKTTKKAVEPEKQEKPAEPIEQEPKQIDIDERYKLFDYQEKTVERMQQIESYPKCDNFIFDLCASYGINENSFGAGKTRTTLRLIEDDKLTFENCKHLITKRFVYSYGDSMLPYMHSNNTLTELKNFQTNYEERIERIADHYVSFKKINATLICMDKKLIGEWQKEAKAVGFSDFISIQVPSDITMEKMNTMMPLLMKDTNTTCTIFISMALYADFIDAVSQYLVLNKMYNRKTCLLFKRMVFDDLHATSKCGRVMNKLPTGALFTWFLNATPDLMQNRMQYVSDNHLNVVCDFKRFYHKVKFQVPIDVYVPPTVRVENHYYKSARIMHAINDAIPIEVREMFATGDYDGAYRRLMGRQDHEDAVQVKDRKPIHELVIGRLQKELDAYVAERERYRLFGYRTEHYDGRIAEHQQKIEALKKRVQEALEKCECPICMDDCDRNSMTITKCCSNAFCRGCIGDLFKGKNAVPCPLCRHDITMKELYIFDEAGNAVDVRELTDGVRNRPNMDNMPTSFQQILEKLIVERPEGRILVFAPYQGTSDAIKVYLRGGRVKYTELTGITAPSVAKRLEQFEKGEFQVLFLNSRFANSGFNLQHATDIIIISGEQFNIEHPTVKQIVSRVARFPRTEEVPVHVIRPMTVVE